MMRLKPFRVVVRIVRPRRRDPVRKIRPEMLLGVALAISESLPFVDSEYNGILHALKAVKIQLEKADRS